MSPVNQGMFKDHPRMFAPQYGGFCAYAMSRNALRPVDPEIFQIVDGRLMLQHTQKAYELFNKNLDANIVRAEKNWPKKAEKRAGKKVKYDKEASHK